MFPVQTMAGCLLAAQQVQRVHDNLMILVSPKLVADQEKPIGKLVLPLNPQRVSRKDGRVWVRREMQNEGLCDGVGV